MKNKINHLVALTLLSGVAFTSTQSHAMSCSASTTDGLARCFGQDYSASIQTTQPRGPYDRYGSAFVDARTGSMSGHITLADSDTAGGPGLGNGQFGASFDETFRITGPATIGPVMVDMIFDVSGSLSGNCIFCSASLSFLFQLNGANFSGFQSSVGGARSLAQPDWTINTSLFGLNSSILIDPNAAIGSLSFDVSSVLGFDIRVRGDIGGTVAFVGANADGSSITADASHTALFNFLLPAGYVLTPNTNANFLAAPILQPVPVPAAVWLFGSGLVGLIGFFRRKAGTLY